MQLGGLLKREVRQKESLGTQSTDGVKRGFPELKVDIRWRRGGKNVGMAIHADSCGVANKRRAVAQIEIGNVMGSVAGRVEYRYAARAKRNGFAPGKHAEIFLRHGNEIAVEPVHLVSVQTGSAAQQLRRINHMRSAALVDVDLQTGVLADQGARRTGMIQVNVGQQDKTQVGNAKPSVVQLRAQRVDRRAGSRIDESGDVIIANERAGDRTRMSDPV